MTYHWNWHIFWELSPEGNGTYLDMLFSGLWWTVLTSLAAWLLALAFGSAVGIARTLPIRPLQWITATYVELFRNIPLLVQLFLWYFVLPEVVPHAWGLWMKQLPNAAFYSAVAGVGFFTSSRVAEQVRAGIVSLPRGQAMAGKALGLTVAQVYRYVLLPVAYRIILPPLTSEFLNAIKNTSVALSIGLLELTARARSMQEFSFQVFESFTAATVMYMAINLVVVVAMRMLERRLALPGHGLGR